MPEWRTCVGLESSVERVVSAIVNQAGEEDMASSVPTGQGDVVA